MSIWAGIKTAMGIGAVADTVTGIVEKIAGTDWTPTQKADFALKYAEVTKYQSPIRRMLASVYVLVWAVMVLVWLLSTIVGHSFDFNGALAIARDTKAFMGSNINLAMNAILGFYFLMGLKK